MPNIVEPDVTVFLNEAMRPFSNILVGVAQDVDLATIRWVNTVLPLMSGNADGDLIFDGSEDDGRTQLNKGEAVTLAAAIVAVRAAITPEVLAVMVKASTRVRHLSAFDG